MLRHVAGVGTKVMDFVLRTNVEGANASHKVLDATAKITADNTFIFGINFFVLFVLFMLADVIDL